MTLATVVLAAMIGLLEVSGTNPARECTEDQPRALTGQNRAPMPAYDEESGTIQRIVKTVPALVSAFAAFTLFLHLWCVSAGTETLLSSARGDASNAAKRYTSAITALQGLVVLVVVIAALSIFVNYASG